MWRGWDRLSDPFILASGSLLVRDVRFPLLRVLGCPPGRRGRRSRRPVDCPRGQGRRHEGDEQQGQREANSTGQAEGHQGLPLRPIRSAASVATPPCGSICLPPNSPARQHAGHERRNMATVLYFIPMLTG